MSNQSNESEKTIHNFSGDAVNGESIVGGAGKIILPTLVDPNSGNNNSGFIPVQGEIPQLVNNDTTLFTTNADPAE